MFWKKKKKEIAVEEIDKCLKSGNVSRIISIKGEAYDLPFEVYVDLTDKEDKDVLDYIFLLEMQELKKYVEKTNKEIDFLKHRMSVLLKKNARMKLTLNKLTNNTQNG